MKKKLVISQEKMTLEQLSSHYNKRHPQDGFTVNVVEDNHAIFMAYHEREHRIKEHEHDHEES